MKKMLNDPNRVAIEVVEGIALAYPHLVRKLDGIPAILRNDAPRADRVAVITGGGSGHEPLFAGYVGVGMATASVAGNVFTSPPPMPIYQTAKAVHGGMGVLFLYGNYAGDVLNFDSAAEMLMEDDGIAVESVQVTDDLASAPAIQIERRRGIAGGVLVFKIAGACAEEGHSLADVAAAARLANGNTRTIGVALSSCVIPASGKAIFKIEEDEIEIGMGIHGEPGMARTKLVAADELASILLGRITDELSLQRGNEVAVLINGLGATAVSELFTVSRAVSLLLLKSEVNICRTYVGNYATSLDMAGCSITVMKLNAELKHWLLAPAETSGFVQVQG